MRALIVEGPGRVAVAQIPSPERTGAALVEVTQGGLCGTDYKVVRGDVPVKLPLVLGHEVVGRLLDPGNDCDLKVGTRVLIDPSIACGRCESCKRSLEHLCSSGGIMGRDYDGGFAEIVAVHDVTRLHPIPDSVSDEDAAVLQVLGTCVHAQRLFTVFPTDHAVVIGLGTSGLLHVQLLQARGVRNLLGVSRSESKRTLAMGLGASAAVAPAEAAMAVEELTAGRGAELVIEAVGTEETLRQAIELAGPAGTVMVFGTITGQGGGLPYYGLYFKELKLMNSRAARPIDYDDAISLVRDGAVTGSPLVSARLPLEAAPGVLENWATEPGRMKVMLDL